MEENIKSYPYLVICDGRFQNEADLINKYNGTIIKIERPDHVSITGQNEKKHLSEMVFNSIETHYTVTNDGSVDDLLKKVRNIVDNDLESISTNMYKNCYIPESIGLDYKFVTMTLYGVILMAFYMLYLSI